MFTGLIKKVFVCLFFGFFVVFGVFVCYLGLGKGVDEVGVELLVPSTLDTVAPGAGSVEGKFHVFLNVSHQPDLKRARTWLDLNRARLIELTLPEVDALEERDFSFERMQFVVDFINQCFNCLFCRTRFATNKGYISRWVVCHRQSKR